MAGGLFIVLVAAHAEGTFYWNGTGAGNNANNWGVNPDGSGAHPGNFTADNQTFVVLDGQDLNNFSGNWVVSGANSGVLIQTGGTMTAGSRNPTISLSMQSGGTYVVSSNYTNLSVGTLDPGSTFVFGGSLSSIRDLAYGGFQYDSSTTATAAGALTVSGDLAISQGILRASDGAGSSGLHAIGGSVEIASGATYEFGVNTAASSTINLGGNLANSGTLRNTGAAVDATMNFDGTGSSTAQWGTHSGKFSVGIASGKTVRFLDSLHTGDGNVEVSGTLLVNDDQSIATGFGVMNVTGTFGTDAANGVVTVDTGGGVTFAEGSAIALALGAGGEHSTLARQGTGAWTFASDQVFQFLDLGAETGTYTGIVTGLTSDPGVSGWRIANPDWAGYFTFNAGSIDFSLTSIAVIPEPNAAELLVAVLTACYAWRRRRVLHGKRAA